MTTIAIASGKGGTGKTTVAVNLCSLLNKKNIESCLLDCDVEEPNCHLFLKAEKKESRECYSYIPEIDRERCCACGKCVAVCEYKALAKAKSTIILFPELCHACGSCELICPNNAIQKGEKSIGILTTYETTGTLNFKEGLLKIREPLSPSLIRSVKNQENVCSASRLTIIDCPPGTACSMVAAVEGVDFVVMVTEPTLFGLHDLKLAVEVTKILGLPCGIIINKSCDNDEIIEGFTKKERIPILGKIPTDENIARCCSRGSIVIDSFPAIKSIFENILREIIKLTGTAI